jgi:hypothetical protein
VYLTGELKFRAVPDAGLISTPVWVIVGTSEATFVPDGTLTLISVPLITPVAGGSVKLKPLISLESERGVFSPPPGQAPRIKTRVITARSAAILLNPPYRYVRMGG